MVACQESTCIVGSLVLKRRKKIRCGSFVR